MKPALKIIVEKHSDGYVAYPLGLACGAVVGQGDTYEAALSDVRSALGVPHRDLWRGGTRTR